MFELIVSIPAALLRFKDLKVVSNSSVVKSDYLWRNLVDPGGVFFEREGPTVINKKLHSFEIRSANKFLLIFSPLRKVLFFCFILPFISFIICYDLLVFP